MQVQSLFTKHSLTMEETLAAVNFTDLQRQFLQTQLAEIAEAKLRLKLDTANYMAFVQQEAELAGQITILEYLLNLYDAMSQENSNNPLEG